MFESDPGRALKLVVDVMAAGGPPRPRCRLSDGTTGYAMVRTDDCLRAAVATCIQVDIDEVPDARIDERLAAGESVERVDRESWRQMVEWLGGRGYEVVEHAKPPNRGRWLGIVEIPQAFQSHTMVMAGRLVLFDPAVRPGVRTFYPWEVTRGLSFTPKEQ